MYLYVFIARKPPALDGSGYAAYNGERAGAGRELQGGFFSYRRTQTQNGRGLAISDRESRKDRPNLLNIFKEIQRGYKRTCSTIARDHTGGLHYVCAMLR